MSEKDDELKPHYDFDYSKTRPNRFAEKYDQSVRRISLASDVAEEFPTEESVKAERRHYIQLRRQDNSGKRVG